MDPAIEEEFWLLGDSLKVSPALPGQPHLTRVVTSEIIPTYEVFYSATRLRFSVHRSFVPLLRKNKETCRLCLFDVYFHDVEEMGDSGPPVQVPEHLSPLYLRLRNGDVLVLLFDKSLLPRLGGGLGIRDRERERDGRSASSDSPSPSPAEHQFRRYLGKRQRLYDLFELSRIQWFPHRVIMTIVHGFEGNAVYSENMHRFREGERHLSPEGVRVSTGVAAHVLSETFRQMTLNRIERETQEYRRQRKMMRQQQSLSSSSCSSSASSSSSVSSFSYGQAASRVPLFISA
uniref:Uncharacterized protein n=1 Tax=Chromera velia CCMP2878 TaxID=1169474 RepID=A0A0K6S8R9_9ALVE|eukprot:Cvel_25154.t1-p1 / transcript=Cvel_25154.t1 / gene=Cvel_25154 / organism=Chromera_velia_CCMP2878 / gene_product=hypothetical protein / transcript_product=hypothetical protein / location=Cvel_scaffold2813:7608-9305(+) / protein_length=288 / sequence_SO=supercontig / SO=protein_coding / is_pseudo=false